MIKLSVVLVNVIYSMTVSQESLIKILMRTDSIDPEDTATEEPSH